MQILHHGAVTGVTGSCHELRLDDGRAVLIDCGLLQGAEVADGRTAVDDLTIDFPAEHVAALVVTHVHIDHVGRIPALMAAGFTGPIYCTEPSAVLLPMVLEDAVKIGFTRNRQLIEKFIRQLTRQIVPLPYAVWQSVMDRELVIRFSPAGHILGSAYVTCKLTEQGRTRQVIFSGDLGAPYAPLLPAPKAPWGCDLLVLESTYGDRRHEGRRQRRERLRQLLERAMANGGVVLIPAFSIGRTQELLYEFEDIIKRYRNRPASGDYSWEDIEIIVDSPLAAKFTAAYRTLKPYWDREALQRVRRGRHPLSFENLNTIEHHADHLAVVDYLRRHHRPRVVLAASGMCNGGRIVNYLKALLGESRNDVVFVGFQAQGTPGRQIQQYGPKGGYVFLDGERYDIRAGVHTLSGYSAHADQLNLLNFIKRMRRKPQEIRLVHGDPEAKAALQTILQQTFPDVQVLIPEPRLGSGFLD
ncbi:MAG TPA: MBL fold metallo-hydrolase [Desulfuromonadales bacterium]|nr:MBL fold metallo-hydrolase [Desulfuromonadales bacterium]